MLFDLKGKRKRAVQITYLGLAILLGAGLVLFGIGSSVNGGLGDLFKGGNGSNKANETIQKKIDTAEKTLQTQPKNAAALASLVKNHLALASANIDPKTNDFGAKSQPDLVAAVSAWDRYDSAVKDPKPDVAKIAIQAGDALGRLGGNSADNGWKAASSAAEVLAAANPKPNSYAILVQYATLAGQTRKADLAAKQAVKVAPKSQKKAAKQQVATAKANAAQLQQQSTQSGQQGTATPSPSG